MIIELFKKFRNQLVVEQAGRAKLPEFPEDRVCRYRVLFSGRVQGVGFRLEVTMLSQRLGLTGFCENLASGDVLAELQGPKNRIDYLISFMESLVRIRIDQKIVTQIPVIEGDAGFEQK